MMVQAVRTRSAEHSTEILGQGRSAVAKSESAVEDGEFRRVCCEYKSTICQWGPIKNCSACVVRFARLNHTYAADSVLRPGLTDSDWEGRARVCCSDRDLETIHNTHPDSGMSLSKMLLPILWCLAQR
jgi:hypothetical protein